jgi:hypothetical protein
MAKTTKKPIRTKRETCQHPHRDGSPCRFSIRFRAIFADGRVTLICGRHGNSIAVANRNGQVRFEEIGDLPEAGRE